MTLLILPAIPVKAAAPSEVVNPAEQMSLSDMPFQRRTFHAQGLFWAFYWSGFAGGLAYKTSSDGATWSVATVVRVGFVSVNRSSTFFDGTFVSYVFLVGAPNGLGYYRKGLLNSDGTITWPELEQTIITPGVGNSLYYPSITVDSTGKPWVGYYELDGAGTAIPKVTTSSTSTGIWTTSVGFPYTLDAVGAATSWAVLAVPQTAGKVYCVYATAGATIKGRPWTGLAWGASEVVSTAILNNCEAYTAVGDGDKIELVMNEALTTSIIHLERVVTWTEVAIVMTSSITAAYPTLSFDKSGNYYCFWINAPVLNHLYYKEYSNGTWGDLVDFVDESVIGFEVGAGSHPLVSYNSNDSFISLLYLAGTAPNCILKFTCLDTTEPLPRTLAYFTGSTVNVVFVLVAIVAMFMVMLGLVKGGLPVSSVIIAFIVGIIAIIGAVFLYSVVNSVW